MIVLRPTAGALVLCLALSAGLAGCTKKAPAATPAPPPPAPPAAPVVPPPPPPPPAPPATPPSNPVLSEEEIFKNKTLEQLNAERPLSDVFFDLDQATIRDEARGLLQKDVDWLKRWSGTRITVEGHCDERGSTEYNLALGERRANAVREYLMALGVPGTRVQIVSKGKESPFCSESNEGCWQQNRRGHFVITAK